MSSSPKVSKFIDIIRLVVEHSISCREKYGIELFNRVGSHVCSTVYSGNGEPLYRLHRYLSPSEWIDELGSMIEDGTPSGINLDNSVKAIDLSAALCYICCFLSSIEKDEINPSELRFISEPPRIYSEPYELKDTSGEVLHQTPLSDLNPDLDNPAIWEMNGPHVDINHWLNRVKLDFVQHQKFEGIDNAFDAAFADILENKGPPDNSFLLDRIDSSSDIAILAEIGHYRVIIGVWDKGSIADFFEVMKDNEFQDERDAFFPLFYTTIGLAGAFSGRDYARNQFNLCHHCDGAFQLFAVRRSSSKHGDEDGNPIGYTIKCANPECLMDMNVDWHPEDRWLTGYKLFESMEEYWEQLD